MFPRDLLRTPSVLLAVLSFSGVLAWSARGALEDEVLAYEAQDAASPPPKDAILFVGSSSIRGWSNLSVSFPGYTVLNRGFGGSQMSDLLSYFDRLVVPYSPPLIVVYEADNDLAGGKPASQVFDDYKMFATRVEQRLPAAEIVFISVKPSPSRVQFMPQMVAFNTLLREFCAAKPHFRFVDVYAPMLNASGQPRPELFQGDMLHMLASGYVLWTALLEPVLAEAPFLASRSLLLDFGAAASTTEKAPAPDDPINAWNNVSAAIGTSATGQLANLVAVDGTATPFDLSVVSPFAGSNEAGTLSSGLYPTDATRDSLFGNTESFEGRSNVFPGFRLAELNAGATYHFTFYASRTGVSDNRETLYTVAGRTTGTAVLNAANNTSALAEVPAVKPDAAGTITISLAPGAANTNANHFTYLAVLKIEERPVPAPVGFTDEPDDQTVTEFRPVTFTAAVSGPPPTSVQWFLDDAPIPGAVSLVHTIPQATLAMDGARLSVEVGSLEGGVTSRQAVLHVTADVTAPAVQSAASADGSTVEILFSEWLKPASVPGLANYLVNGGAIPVLGAVLRPDGRTIALTLAHRVSGQVTVQVVQVQDLAGNAVAAATTVSFQAPLPQPQTWLFDFGAGTAPTTKGVAPNDPANAWNNVSSIGLSDTGQLTALVTTENAFTGLGLVMLSRFNGANESGTTGSTLFPANATRDSLFGNTELFNGLTNIFPRFKLTGLNPARRYDFTFYASRTGATDNRETGYTVTGATSALVALNAANNLNGAASIAAVAPDAAGQVTVSLAPTPSNTNPNHFTYLGVMQVRLVEPLAFLPPVVANGKIIIDWTGQGILEWSSTLAEPWTPVQPTSAPPYLEDLGNAARKFFRLRPAP